MSPVGAYVILVAQGPAQLQKIPEYQNALSRGGMEAQAEAEACHTVDRNN